MSTPRLQISEKSRKLAQPSVDFGTAGRGGWWGGWGGWGGGWGRWGGVGWGGQSTPLSQVRTGPRWALFFFAGESDQARQQQVHVSELSWDWFGHPLGNDFLELVWRKEYCSKGTHTCRSWAACRSQRPNRSGVAEEKAI